MAANLPWQDPLVIAHCQALDWSFRHWTGSNLLSSPAESPLKTAQLLFEAPFALLSHGTEPDPVLNYGNQVVLELWQMDWATLTRTPSRLTAEPEAQSRRQELLAQAETQGYISNYAGIRISSQGKRFAIANVTIWNVITPLGLQTGQAAMFTAWQFLA
ncbi:MAG: MEKHLA domain-containing protein [Pseudanabaenaceae cyanobacterium bins.68]|nr:MEKHLA domain-containing protein [Pseudanabaenaceae cyanobacterium bins.68]